MDEEKKDFMEETAEAPEQEKADAEQVRADAEQSKKTGLTAFFSNKKRVAVISVLAVLLLLALGIGIAFGSGCFERRPEAAQAQASTGAELTEVSGGEEASEQTKTTPAFGQETVDTSEEADDESETEKESSSEKISSEEAVTTQEKSTEEKTTEEAHTTEKASEGTQGTKAPETTTQAIPDETAPAAGTGTGQTESGTPYSNHGKLTVSGTNILDQNGDIYQLRGVSTHGIGWFPDYVNKAAFQTMRDEWGINVVRIAMYTAEYNGYCSGGDQTWLKNLVDTGVQAATELGLYVIIDWHILSDSNPNTNKASSLAFFKEISAKYASYGNVLYEICNEPNGGVSWSEIKSYAEEVIPVIRANAKDSIIIVGTPTWSQDVDQAAANSITGQVNIMYALHFYAATHKDDLRNKMTSAIAAGLPIFVTEYGICDASGNGGIDEASANAWVSVMNQNHVSYCIWNLSNKSETSALISSGCTKTSGWSSADLSASGKWFVNMMKGNLSGLGTTQGGSSGGGQPQATQTQPTQPTTQYVPPTTQAPQQASAGNCSAEVNNTNSWGDSSQGYHMQLEVKLQNTGSSAVTGWKVVLTFSGAVEVESSWNGTIAVNGSTITITSDADWNATIQSGASIQPGLIVKSASEVQLTGCSVQ